MDNLGRLWQACEETETGYGLVRNFLLLWIALTAGYASGNVALADSLTPPDSQNKVCEAFARGAAEFAPLQQAWKQTEDNKNGIAKTVAQDALRQKINAVWTTRNRMVLGLMPSKNLKGWLGKADKMNIVERDYGKDTQRHIEIGGRFDCVPPITFTSKQIEATPKLITILGKLNVGDSVILDGTLIAHDTGAQPIEDAVEWGGILWGPFSGLWGDDAFNRPAFQIKTTNLAVP